MVKMLIGGEPTDATATDELDVIDPATEEIYETVPAGGVDAVELAVQAAAAAFPAWSAMDAEQRAELMRKALELIGARRDEIVETLTHEQGKPTMEAAGELQHFLHGMHYYADLATKVRGAYQELPSTLGRSYGMVIRRPVGPVAAIVPYNYPLTLMGTKIGPALAAGNTVVVKPASSTPLATLKVAELFHEAGLPAGVLNVVTGRGSAIGDALVTHALIRRVAFTGETGTGKHIAELAAPAFKRISLELGGSDPMIVCPDADVPAAIKGAAIARFWNAGQSCLAAKRLYVFDGIYDDFIGGLSKELERYECGTGWTKPEKPKLRIGPVHTKGGQQELAEQLDDAVARGASVLVGGGPPSEPRTGYFFQPTLVEDAPHDSRLVQEEVFGPILPVFRVRDIDEAIRLANDTRYGLGSSIWTYDARYIDKAAQELEAGMTWVNQIHYGYDELPFGGLKESGLGKEHGLEAMMDYYFETKSVVVGGLN
ncbi:MAG: aldehyde dehydrogenase family protein [Actinomycetota bacterium]|nr:aldehyde dehydrogenase family protein [Actinomycetota bacterium]